MAEGHNYPGLESKLEAEWKTKPSDRFVLKWIKINLSSRVSQKLIGYKWLRPWMITVISMVTGVAAGILFSINLGFLAGLMAAVSQILDGVDGQIARLTGRSSNPGAFLDSVLDRYSDGCLVIGLTIYNLHNNSPFGPAALIALGALALIGSGLISYSTARAESLGISFGTPTLASKGTRTTVVAVSGLLSPINSLIPLVALVYLVVHTNTVVLFRIYKARRQK
ncbi:MAG: CDP-alcohol phosphatidyltransferase family protein [Desulfomonilaceae bacterium]